MGLWERRVVIGEVAKDSGTMSGGEGWVHASSGCPNIWELDLGDPCVVVGLCGHPETTGHVVETCRGSPHDYGGWGVHTEVACRIRHMLLCESCRVALRSRELFSFCERGIARA